MMSGSALAVATRMALRAACLLAVLVGMFGMHGLASHGVGGMEAMPPTFIAQTVDTMLSVADSATERDSAGLGPVSADGEGMAVGGTSEHGGMDMSMAGLCLAVLVLGGLGAASMWLRRDRLLCPGWVLPRLVAVIPWEGRDRDPPSLHNLSIRRC